VNGQFFTRAAGSPDRRPSHRLLLIAVVLLAFVIQSFATQTHIHPLPGVSADAALKLVASGTHNKKGNTPTDDSPDNCPLCQLFYGGQYVAPTTLVFFLPMAAVSTIEIALGVTPHYDAVSHSWRGRGPPRR
jgi:hypothetical protein